MTDSNLKRTPNSAIPATLLEGLALDVSILDALLKRHRCSHGRTVYFRRMSMTLNRLLRRDSDCDGTPRKEIVVTDMVSRLNNLQKKIFDCNQEQKLKSTSSKKRRRTEEEKWDLQSLQKATATSTPASPSTLIIQDLKELINFWTNKIPEILSRIQHASKSLFIEVSRGFFLPFCTVALSALARIRSLLMEIGVRGLTSVRALSDEALQVLPKNDACSLRPILTDIDFERCTNLFMENDDGENDRQRKFLMQRTITSQNEILDREAILMSLGLMESTKNSPKREGTLNHNDSDNATSDNETNDKQSHNSLVIESSSTDDYYTLSSSAPLEQHSGLGEADDVGNSVEMNNGINVDRESIPSKSHDSLDRNMALVNRFQKLKTREKQSKKKDKKSKKLEHDSKLEPKPEESDRKSKKRKHKKESTKQKKKKKGKGDFFDQIFD